MREGFYNIIRGKFLVSDEAPKNWRFIIFLSFLALIMIGSAHSVDKKVRRISILNAEVKELKSEFVDVRIQFMQSKLESRIISTMEKRGFVPSSTPPPRSRIVQKDEKDTIEETQVANRE